MCVYKETETETERERDRDRETEESPWLNAGILHRSQRVGATEMMLCSLLDKYPKEKHVLWFSQVWVELCNNYSSIRMNLDLESHQG